MQNIEQLKEKINHIEEDLISVKNAIITLGTKDNKKTIDAWKDWLSTSKEISKKWKGPSAVQEIKEQREKN